jgi:hypothetical protein
MVTATWRRFLVGSAVALGSLICSSAVPASDAPLAIDPRQDLADLQRSGRVAVQVDRLDGVYVVDASAVVHAELPALLEASLDYDRYARIGMPHVREMRSWSPGRPGSPLRLELGERPGRSSKHYLAVRVHPRLGPSGDAGIEWTLARRRSRLALRGGLGVQTARRGVVPRRSERTVYVRSVVTAVFDPGIPEAMAPWLVKRQLREGARGAIETLVRAAASRS